MRFFNSALVLASAIVPALAAPVEVADLEVRAAAGLTKIKLPASTLPAPAAGQVLKWIGLGIGTQNYTCAAGAAAPASAGAVASLYDLSGLNNDPLASMKIPTISALALGASNLNKQVLALYLTLMGYNTNLGVHFFNKTMTPTFKLSGLKKPVPFPELYAKKIANVPAPTSACKGTKNEGAVDWLFLDDVGTSISGVKSVYRVETAGGKAPATCDGQPATINVPYVAQYWFFGPA